MLKKDEVSLYPVEEKHLPSLVKWGNAGGLFKEARSKRRTNVVEQEQRLKELSEKESYQALMVYLKGTEWPVGICELIKIDWINRTCFINVYLEDKEKAVGIYGFKILKLVLEYIFKRLGLYKVSVDVLLEQNIETALYKQLSFKVEVRKRKHAFIAGSYKTVLEMSLLKHEFDKEYS